MKVVRYAIVLADGTVQSSGTLAYDAATVPDAEAALKARAPAGASAYVLADADAIPVSGTQTPVSGTKL